MAISQKAVEISGISQIVNKLLKTEKSIGSVILMGRIGEFIKTKVKMRTSEGKDADGHFFKPYSKAYREYRLAHGRPVDRVNLTFFGTMLSSMTSDAQKDMVTVYFLNTPDFHSGGHVTNAQKAFFLNEDRRFFALSQAEVKKVKEMVEAYLSWESQK